MSQGPSRNIDDDISRSFMPHEKKLGFDRDGNVYVKEYLTHLGLYWDGKFGRMAECLKDRSSKKFIPSQESPLRLVLKSKSS